MSIEEVITDLAASFDDALFKLSADDILDEWLWRWDSSASDEWNLCEFVMFLELHKRRWRRWEEHHNGSCCVVERVRDKYEMPRVREFLKCLRGEE